MLTIVPAGRFFAVLDGPTLVCTTVYRIGALAVAERIAGPAGYRDETPRGLAAARVAERRRFRPAPPPAPTVTPVPAAIFAAL